MVDFGHLLNVRRACSWARANRRHLFAGVESGDGDARLVCALATILNYDFYAFRRVQDDSLPVGDVLAPAMRKEYEVMFIESVKAWSERMGLPTNF